MKHKTKFAALLFTSLSVFLLSCNQPKVKDETIVTTDKSAAPVKVEAVKVEQIKPADKNQLVGNWIRTDAPYQIEITAVQEDGNLIAGYFNPKTINVDKAMWNDADGLLKVYIELRDVNYPGSNYKLTYSPEQDELAGEYFQAVEGNTYNVAFTRGK